jgi:hypothetical protein
LKAMIERIALDALALRSQLPDLRLREGASVVARVAARQADHGVIVLAGAPLVAKLPPEVEAGQTLHLRVAEVTPEQVTLRLDQAAMLAQQAAQPPPAPRPPEVTVGEPPRRGGGGDESAAVALAFDSDVLGRLDLRIDLARGIVSARVDAPAGPALALAEEAADRLREALAAKTGRTAHVTVLPRRDPFDAYA